MADERSELTLRELGWWLVVGGLVLGGLIAYFAVGRDAAPTVVPAAAEAA